MDQPLAEKNPRKLRILVAPLDWGLGHATRCIPLIKTLLEQGVEVVLAGEGAQEHLLRNEFPALEFLSLKGYRIRYARTRPGLIWKMISQGPKMRRAILYEHRWLKKKAREHAIDAVISDNRYGLYHKNIPCIFITHQLKIRSSAGKWTENILQQRNYRFIDKFTACWVPDTEGVDNLAGDLSHPNIKPKTPIHYIGPLTRFEKIDLPEQKGHLAVVLSGPEPQRSILEEKIIAEISHYNGTAVIVRGLPGSSSMMPSTNMIRFFNHLSSTELNRELQSAEFVISRSGYSTVMDLVKLNKKCIYIPTPGQTEQEYLAARLMENRFALCFSQSEFSLEQALFKAASFPYRQPIFGESRLKETIVSLLRDLK